MQNEPTLSPRARSSNYPSCAYFGILIIPQMRKVLGEAAPQTPSPRVGRPYPVPPNTIPSDKPPQRLRTSEPGHAPEARALVKTPSRVGVAHVQA
jgi:hypothetical protein